MSKQSRKQRKRIKRERKNNERKQHKAQQLESGWGAHVTNEGAFAEDSNEPLTMLWHYTCGDRLDNILRTGVIRLATGGIDKGEKPAVWFSSNPIWEETANKMLMDSTTGQSFYGTKETTHRYGGGLARIGVAPETAPINWEGFCRQSGASKKMLTRLKSAAYRMDSHPSQWFVSFVPVPKEKWLVVELWDGNQWVVAPLGPIAQIDQQLAG